MVALVRARLEFPVIPARLTRLERTWLTRPALTAFAGFAITLARLATTFTGFTTAFTRRPGLARLVGTTFTAFPAALTAFTGWLKGPALVGTRSGLGGSATRGAV